MSQEFVSLLKSLKVPRLNLKEIATLEQSEQEWQHWQQREKQTMPLRIEAARKSAYAAFLEEPSEAKEQRPAVLSEGTTGLWNWQTCISKQASRRESDEQREISFTFSFDSVVYFGESW